jgi:hypothetical protein
VRSTKNTYFLKDEVAKEVLNLLTSESELEWKLFYTTVPLKNSRMLFLHPWLGPWVQKSASALRKSPPSCWSD